MQKPDYDEGVRKEWQANIEECRENPLQRFKELESSQKYRRMGISLELIRHWLCTDDTAAYFFAKDPSKQTYHQKVARDWIKALPGVSQMEQLDVNGDDAKYLSAGNVISGRDIGNTDGKKSLDFEWKFIFSTGEFLRFYASHKYTNESGGAQDNQFEELRKYTKEANGLRRETGYRLLAIADGDFYKRKRKGQQLTRIQELSQECQASPFSRALTTEDIPAYLAQCIAEYSKNSLRRNLDASEESIVNELNEISKALSPSQ